MVRAQKAGRKIDPTEPDAFSISRFCQRHGISISMFYKMRAQDPKSVPRVIHVGKRRLISKEAAAHWRAERETATYRAKEPASAEVTADAADRRSGHEKRPVTPADPHQERISGWQRRRRERVSKGPRI
jgi:hypothetical protein